jgi:threonine/homoserine/homoserine lactone efflux protein
VHGTLSILGISIILVQSAQLFFIVKMIGAAYLCCIGVKALWQAWTGAAARLEAAPAARRNTLWRAVAEGFLTNALNPKVSMFYLAAFPQFIAVSENTVEWGLVLVTVHAMLNVIWFGSLVLLFSSLKGLGRKAWLQRALQAVTGTIFVAFGLKLATLKP